MRLIAAMCGCAFFTMKYAQSHVISGPDTIMTQSSEGSSQTSGNQQSNDPQSGQPGGDAQNDQNASDQNGQGDENGQGGTPPDMNASGSSSTLLIGYYFVFGVEGIILAAGVMYLIMTRGGKKSIK